MNVALFADHRDAPSTFSDSGSGQRRFSVALFHFFATAFRFDVRVALRAELFIERGKDRIHARSTSPRRRKQRATRDAPPRCAVLDRAHENAI